MSKTVRPDPAPTSNDVVLQVSLAPVDFPHARHILPHQIRQWRDQVDRIVLCVDTRPGSGRYAEAWGRHDADFEGLVNTIASVESSVCVVEVDYSPRVERELSKAFVGGREVPVKDCHGAPFYAYLFGLMAAGSRYVLHTDADMLYGGGSSNWMQESLLLFRDQEDVLFTGPYPGPPTADGNLLGAVAARAAGSQRYGSPPRQVGRTFPALQFKHVSTRSFLIDLDRFHGHARALVVEAVPPPRLSRRSPGAAPLEVSLSRALNDHNLVRVDLLGEAPGMWALHPPYRTAAFVRDLPELIRRVEAADVPESQRGDFDLNDSMVDWSAPRRQQHRRQRREKVRRLSASVAERISCAQALRRGRRKGRGWEGRGPAE